MPAAGRGAAVPSRSRARAARQRGEAAPARPRARRWAQVSSGAAGGLLCGGHVCYGSGLRSRARSARSSGFLT